MVQRIASFIAAFILVACSAAAETEPVVSRSPEGTTVRATRITYVGELGWELYVPAEFAVGVYEDLTTAGADLGIVDRGRAFEEAALGDVDVAAIGEVRLDARLDVADQAGRARSLAAPLRRLPLCVGVDRAVPAGRPAA